MKEELSKVLDAWKAPEAPEEKNTAPFRIINNVARTVFQYVADHPGCSGLEVGDALSARGFKRSSVSAILSQLKRQNTVRNAAHKYYAVAAEYEPIKAMTTVRVVRKDPVVAAPVAQVAQVAQPEVSKTTISNLSLHEAYALYVELAKFFGPKVNT
jgi:hypothetical protein